MFVRTHLPVLSLSFFLPLCLLACCGLRSDDGSAPSFHTGLFCWMTLIQQWNQLARSDSIASLMLAHFDWDCDHMVVTNPRSKCDQEGEATVSKSVFANPEEPVVCPILSLAIYILTTHQHRDETSRQRLFDGAHPAERYGKILRRTAARLLQREEDVGTHSVRKGGITFCFSRPGGPPGVSSRPAFLMSPCSLRGPLSSATFSPLTLFTPCLLPVIRFLFAQVAICLRADWSPGPVKERYIVQETGAEEFCGRTAAALDIMSTSFAALPPHFHDETVGPLSEVIKSFLPYYEVSFTPDCPPKCFFSTPQFIPLFTCLIFVLLPMVTCHQTPFFWCGCTGLP